MTIKYCPSLVQGSDEWFECRRGLLTASEMKHAISKKTDRKTGEVTYEAPDADKMQSHLYEIAAQRISGFVEPHFIGDHMIRGHEDEILARAIYSKKYAPVTECGFITNDKWGFTLGYSPDGLVSDDGQIEIKSRIQKYQFETIVTSTPPDEFKIQLQTGLLISERKWCDFISYSGGLPMKRIRVLPDEKIQTAILKAAEIFHQRLDDIMKKYQQSLVIDNENLTPTERRKPEREIIL